MDAIKTGTLIAQARREKGMTQKELSELLHVTDRAVSKWEVPSRIMRKFVCRLWLNEVSRQ